MVYVSGRNYNNAGEVISLTIEVESTTGNRPSIFFITNTGKLQIYRYEHEIDISIFTQIYDLWFKEFHKKEESNG